MDDKKNNQYESMDLDDLLPELGEFGNYQKLLLWMVCLPACLPCGFCAFNQLFMTEIPDYWCNIPLLQNLTINERRRLGIPSNNGSYSKCEEYAVDWKQLVLDNDLTFLAFNESWPIRQCSNGWEYNTSEVFSSIVIEFNLVCDRDIYPTLGLVALNVGGPIGVYSFGLINDTIGRKKSFFICLSTLLIGGILTSMAQNFWWWACSRFIVGLTIPAMYQIPFIISLEFVGPNYRSFITVMTCMFYTFGLILLSGITYLIPDWVQLSYVTCLPFFFYYIYWFFLPESPRWLLAKGRYVDAINILQKLAKVNNREIPEDLVIKIKRQIIINKCAIEKKNTRSASGIVALCNTPNIRLKTCLITLNWFANETVYVGLSYYAPSLGSNRHLNFLLSSVVEIPSYIVCWLAIDRWGRRWPLCLCMIISGVCCIATVAIPPENETVTLALYLVSKSAISASFLIIYPFAGELYPTELRGIGIGTSAYIGGIGLIFIPFITYLGSEMYALPLFIMGIISIIGGLLGLRLPETLHHRLPQTIEEGEEFGKEFSLEDCWKCAPLKSDLPTACSYEDLEMHTMRNMNEETPLEYSTRKSIHKFVKQSSIVDTQKDVDGTMKMTYWF